MRIFHHQVFDGWVNSSGSILNMSDYIYATDLGNIDMFSVGGYATQVSGTSPTLTIGFFGTCDLTTFLSFGVASISGLSLSTSQETFFQGLGPHPANDFKYPYVGLSLSMGGTNPRGYFRVWVTGRDKSRRSKSMMKSLTDAGELALPAET